MENSYILAKMLKLKAGLQENRVTFEPHILGDFVITFDVEVVNAWVYGAGDGIVEGEFCIYGGGTPAYVLSFQKDGIVYATQTKTKICAYSMNNISFGICYHCDTRLFDIYVNGECKLKDYCADSSLPVTFDKCWTIDFAFSSQQSDTEVRIKNLVAYPLSDAPSDALAKNSNSIRFSRLKKFTSTGKKIIPNDSKETFMLEGFSAIHMRSGIVYKDGKKYVGLGQPFYKDGDSIIPLDSATLIFGEKPSIRFVIDNNGTPYVNLNELTNYYGKQLFIDRTSVHFGLAIISDKNDFASNGKEELQRINNFLFFERPSQSQVYEDFVSQKLENVHPRVLATDEDFAKINQEILSNKNKQHWYNRLIKYCDSELSKMPALRYEFRDGVRLMYVSEDFSRFMMCLGMAYRLTGEKKYFDWAWKHIEAVSSMPDWNPSHHIDVGIMAFGFAIAYDWFFDALSQKQKELMERCAYDNCLYTVCTAFENEDTAYGTVMHSNNHNVYTNRGVLALCVAFMDRYKEECSSLCSDIIRVLEYFLDKYAPDGDYYEGPNYATIAINYTVGTLAVIGKAFGKYYSLDKIQGFERAGEYLINLESDVSSFNFADGDFAKVRAVGTFWIFSHYGLKGYSDMVAANSFQEPPFEEDNAFSLLWYDINLEKSNILLPLDVYYQNNEIITMRNSYESGQVFIGIKAGETVYAHSHLDSGSFIFDALGKRWAYDLGPDDYNLYYKYDSWDVFRLRAEAHNTLLVDPDGTPGYIIGSHAPVVQYESKDCGVIVQIDMTDLYGDKVSSAARGYYFTDNRKSLVIRDEVTVNYETDIYWLMYIDADCIIDGDKILLTDKIDKSRQLLIDFISSHEFELFVEPAKPFAASPQIPEQDPNDGFFRICCRAHVHGNATITVKLTPIGVDGSCIKDYDKSIQEWRI